MGNLFASCSDRLISKLLISLHSERVKKEPRPVGGTGRGLDARSPLRPAGHLSFGSYSMIWTMRRVRGSTSTVRPFTTV